MNSGIYLIEGEHCAMSEKYVVIADNEAAALALLTSKMLTIERVELVGSPIDPTPRILVCESP